MSDWISFYDMRHSLIYVNARHRDVHYRKIADDIRALVQKPSAAVLDYGCGEATSADVIAAACGHLTMVEAAPNVRAALGARYAGNAKISVLAPDAAAALPAGSFDLIVMHSVAQYLSGGELDRLLATFRKLIKPAACSSSATSCRRAWRRRRPRGRCSNAAPPTDFFWAAVGGLVRIFVSDYLRLRKTVGLSHYEAAAMLEKLKAAGFSATRAPRNIGHNQRRMTFLAKSA